MWSCQGNLSYLVFIISNYLISTCTTVINLSFNIYNTKTVNPLILFLQDAYKEKDTFYLFNHIDITIKYHTLEDGRSRLIKATLEPSR